MSVVLQLTPFHATTTLLDLTRTCCCSLLVQVLSPPLQGFRFAVPGPKLLDWSCPGGQQAEQASAQQFQAAVERLQRIGGVKVGSARLEGREATRSMLSGCHRLPGPAGCSMSGWELACVHAL